MPSNHRAAVTCLWIVTPLTATLSLVIVTVAVTTNCWLVTEESMLNPRYNGTGDRDYLPKHTVSGLWVLCYNNRSIHDLIPHGEELWPPKSEEIQVDSKSQDDIGRKAGVEGQEDPDTQRDLEPQEDPEPQEYAESQNAQETLNSLSQEWYADQNYREYLDSQEDPDTQRDLEPQEDPEPQEYAESQNAQNTLNSLLHESYNERESAVYLDSQEYPKFQLEPILLKGLLHKMIDDLESQDEPEKQEDLKSQETPDGKEVSLSQEDSEKQEAQKTLNYLLHELFEKRKSQESHDSQEDPEIQIDPLTFKHLYHKILDEFQSKEDPESREDAEGQEDPDSQNAQRTINHLLHELFEKRESQEYLDSQEDPEIQVDPLNFNHMYHEILDEFESKEDPESREDAEGQEDPDSQNAQKILNDMLHELDELDKILDELESKEDPETQEGSESQEDPHSHFDHDYDPDTWEDLYNQYPQNEFELRLSQEMFDEQEGQEHPNIYPLTFTRTFPEFDEFESQEDPETEIDPERLKLVSYISEMLDEKFSTVNEKLEDIDIQSLTALTYQVGEMLSSQFLVLLRRLTELENVQIPKVLDLLENVGNLVVSSHVLLEHRIETLGKELGYVEKNEIEFIDPKDGFWQPVDAVDEK